MGKVKVSDFVANFLANHPDTGNTVFMVSGGGIMHLIDSLGKNKNLEYVCNHHEQACTFAAEGYARLTNKIGVAYVTTGPGSTNAITGVYSAWVDSIPMLIVSGQVKRSTTVRSEPFLNLRQLGDQEIDIIPIVKNITKYSVSVWDKRYIKYHLEKAVYEAKNGRPGPAWIEIPLDIQGAFVDEDELIDFIPENTSEISNLRLEEVIASLKDAKRPVIIAGNGIRLANAVQEFTRLIELLKIPVIGTFAGYDILDVENPFYFGRYGTVGQRMANFTVQNSDLILAIGTRMNIRAISYNWEYFAREAKIISVDIDKAELCKRTVDVDIKIQADAKEFITKLIDKLEKEDIKFPKYKNWISKCKSYKKNYPVIEERRKKLSKYVDTYYFFHTLSKVLYRKKNVYVFANGMACVASYQSLNTYKGDRVIVNSGCASMGYDLPAAIGACIGNNRGEVICVAGDGSIQMNIQELQTIVHYNLPIKIFVLNNDGYLSIKMTQNNFFNGNKVGADKDSGVSFPDIIKVGKAYGFRTFRIENQKNLYRKLKNILTEKGPFICEVMINPNEKMEPKLSSEVKPDGKIVSKPLEDMYPFLDRDEFKKNMIINPIEE